MSALFHNQVSSVGIMYVSLAILVVYESRGFRKKTYIDFSSNTFPTNTVITNFIICMKFDLLPHGIFADGGGSVPTQEKKN